MELALINNQDKVNIEQNMESILLEAVKVTLAKHSLPDCLELALVLVEDVEIKTLNNSYRGIDSKTDVLSFPQYDSLEDLRSEFLRMKDCKENDQVEPILLGDIVISLETARDQGEEYGHGLQREIRYLFVHGLLHLLGYDHLGDGEQAKMRQMEEAILGELPLVR